MKFGDALSNLKILSKSLVELIELADK